VPIAFCLLFLLIRGVYIIAVCKPGYKPVFVNPVFKWLGKMTGFELSRQPGPSAILELKLAENCYYPTFSLSQSIIPAIKPIEHAASDSPQASA
jgi:hypothetical protein